MPMIIILSTLLILSVLANLVLAAKFAKAMRYNQNLAKAALTAMEERDLLKNTK